jgi:hypothetical protein
MCYDPGRLIGQEFRRVDQSDLQGRRGPSLLAEHPTDGHPHYALHGPPPGVERSQRAAMVVEGAPAPQCKVSPGIRDESHPLGRERTAGL